MIRKEGKYLANARIDVDYTGDKPNIEFDYPSDVHPNKLERKQISLGYVNIYLLIIIIVLVYLPLFYTTFSLDQEIPNDCYLNKTKNSSWDSFNLVCDGVETEYKHSKVSPWYYINKPRYNVKMEKKETYLSLLYFPYLILLIILYFFFKRIIIRNRLKSPKFKREFPIRQANKSNKLKYQKFLPTDVENNMIFIPNFANVIMDYEATGDFSKYLTHVKIREDNYNTYNKKKNKIGKKKYEHYKWHAKFYFSQPVKTGYLEVKYK